MPSIALSSPSLRLPPSLLSSPFLPSPLLPSCFLPSPLSSHFHAVQQKPQGDFKKLCSLCSVIITRQPSADERICVVCVDSVGSTKIYPGSRSFQWQIAHITVKKNAIYPPWRFVFFSSIIPALFYVLACRGYRPIFSIQAWRMTSWGEQLPSPFSQELIGTICSLWNDLPLISFCFFFSLFPLSSRLKAKEPNNRIKDCLFI